MIRRSVTRISLPPNQEADYTCKMLFSPFATRLSGIWSLPLLLSDSNTNFASPPSLPQSLPSPLLVSHYAVRSSFQTSMQSSSPSFASVQNDPLTSSWIIEHKIRKRSSKAHPYQDTKHSLVLQVRRCKCCARFEYSPFASPDLHTFTR